MTQFEPTGEQIAPEIDLERYGDPEKVRMRAALEALLAAAKAYEATYMRTQSNPSASQEAAVMRQMQAAIDLAAPVFLSWIDQLTREGLAP